MGKPWWLLDRQLWECSVCRLASIRAVALLGQSHRSWAQAYDTLQFLHPGPPKEVSIADAIIDGVRAAVNTEIDFLDKMTEEVSMEGEEQENPLNLQVGLTDEAEDDL